MSKNTEVMEINGLSYDIPVQLAGEIRDLLSGYQGSASQKAAAATPPTVEVKAKEAKPKKTTKKKK